MNTINQQNIKSIAKWAKFLGVFFAIIAVIIAIAGTAFLFARTSEISDAMNNLGYKYPILQSFGSGSFYAAISILFILLAGLIGLTAFYQLNTAKSLNQYLVSNDEQFLYSGLNNVGKYFRFYVVFSIISLLGTLSGLLFMFF
jgi:Family of unknown function (DUF5362)